MPIGSPTTARRDSSNGCTFNRAAVERDWGDGSGRVVFGLRGVAAAVALRGAVRSERNGLRPEDPEHLGYFTPDTGLLAKLHADPNTRQKSTPQFFASKCSTRPHCPHMVRVRVRRTRRRPRTAEVESRYSFCGSIRISSRTTPSADSTRCSPTSCCPEHRSNAGGARLAGPWMRVSTHPLRDSRAWRFGMLREWQA